MKRNEWTFQVSAQKLADAAELKRAHHQELLESWAAKRKLSTNTLDINRATGFISYHDNQSVEYAHWILAFQHNEQQAFTLDREDIHYFFGPDES